MKKILCLVHFVLFLIVISPSTSAQLFFEDDFEDGDFTTGVQWDSTNSDPNNISLSIAHDNTNYLKVNSSGSGAASVYANIETYLNTSSLVDGAYIEFDFKGYSANWVCPILAFSNENGDHFLSFVAQNLSEYSSKTSFLIYTGYFNGNYNYFDTYNGNFDHWYKLKIVFFPTEERVNVNFMDLNRTILSSNDINIYTAFDNISKIYIGSQPADRAGFAAIDNIKFYNNDSNSGIVPTCEMDVMESITFAQNLICPSGNGLNIAAHDIVIDCNFHSIVGPGNGIGINIDTFSGIEIKNCFIHKWNIGIRARQTMNSSFHDNVLTNTIQYDFDNSDMSSNRFQIQ